MVHKGIVRENSMKLLFITLLFLFLSLKSCMVHAQELEEQEMPSFYKGFEASFGVRSFNLTSNIPQLNNLTAVEEGGSVGVVLGGHVVRTKIRAAGFYYSGSSVKRTVNLFESEMIGNFYPLQITKISSRVQPYVTGGVTYDNMKFYGHYLGDQDAKVNYGDPREPYLGKIDQISASAGIGVEWNAINSPDSFVQIFSEVRYGRPLWKTTDRTHFENTGWSESLTVSFGVSFGSIW